MKFSLLTLSGIISLLTVTLSAQTYNPVSDFSTLSNPTGVWTYGYSTSLPGTFQTFTTYLDHSNGLDIWHTPDVGGSLQINRNPNSETLHLGGSEGVTYFTDSLGFHPGSAGEFAILRFTAPVTATYDLTGVWQGIDLSDTTTDVHIRTAETSLLDGNISGYATASGPSFDLSTFLETGEHIDFAVSWGTNGTAYSDSTALTLQISAVPEPSTYAAIGGIFALCLALIRRRKLPTTPPTSL